MTEPSLDTYAGGLPNVRDAHPVDNFIFRHATRLLTNRFFDAMASQSTQESPSGTPLTITELAEEMEDCGIDKARITVGVAIAQLELMRRFGVPHASPNWTGPEDASA